MSWRDLLNRHTDDVDEDPMDAVLADRGHDVSGRVRAIYDALQRTGGYATAEELFRERTYGNEKYFYDFVLGFFRDEVPDDVVRQIGGVTVDAEAAVDAGYLELNRHGTRYKVTDEFEAHAVELVDSTARLTGDEEDAFWTLQRGYRYLADNAPMHEYSLLYEVRQGLPPVVHYSSDYPNRLRLDGKDYQEHLADGNWGPYEVVRYDLFPELPGFSDAGELYLATPEADVPDDATEPAEVTA